MAICKSNLDNLEYNIESNMAAMSLPLPKTVFGSITTVSAALAAIKTALSVKHMMFLFLLFLQEEQVNNWQALVLLFGLVP
ncbi:hypothetical protein [Vibrio neptunius]|uniref:hypothetical protein n=1 Tax=Vibrio neptunius TaxID=170651 RepID=UPI001C5C8D79|nr:hypothetical protein [Vibrio neptunius]QXX08685.1 hypothetical protein KW548_24245 [Vibrio neptunius]